MPTHAFFHSNKGLARARAEAAKGFIIWALKAKKIDVSKLTFTLDSSVQGPEYGHDASDQVKYEKFQYVKVYIH